ncbi:Phosphoglycolate phosphatase [Tetrabaena socialis]|uniref:Phosphoglycolate phosphatase n=1 Tax=Tetrabaena socialis TaxID=47790 RepID=A0A2J8A8L9_9CHLO|nr:Phosphoglycolate phosphatase [Tetrabaena socialis]|eukprot:PNH08869.1 Phosphoglycolate phosphatase [Tetrabaena socialis]
MALGVNEWEGCLGDQAASTSAPWPDTLPLTTLLSKLSRFKALAADKELANSVLAPLVRQLPVNQAAPPSLSASRMSAYASSARQHAVYAASGSRSPASSARASPSQAPASRGSAASRCRAASTACAHRPPRSSASSPSAAGARGRSMGEVNVAKGGDWLLPYLCRSYGLDPRRTAIIGDRMDTDIRMGRQGGLLTCLPLTGVTTLAALAALPPGERPDCVVQSVAQLAGLEA